MLKNRLLLILPILVALQITPSDACTNFLITRGATKDRSTMITYAADSHVLYGELYFWPAADYPDGAMLDVVEWDTGKYMGKIPQVKHTYQVTGNMNENQVAIGETTYGGRKELATQKDALVDYGSLIYISLQRSKTAREAITVMTDLVKNFGYASSGESFSISDANEVWILEMIGKGEGQKGAVWVAMRIPDGYISGHANQARITQFPLNDPKNCLYATDVISFAREKGWFEGKNNEFSFSDTYAPVDFSGARFCDARVWSGFNKVNKQMKQYESYAMGKVTYDANKVATNRMPLWIKPDSLLSLKDVMNMMRDHYEGTELDMTKDPGTGPFGSPYRWRPMEWQVDSVTYVHERAISTQQTGFSFVAQSRPNLPNPIGGILWFGLDDTYLTCYMPIYCGIKQVPNSVKVGDGDMLTWSDNSAFWVFNTVSNQVYTRYSDMIVDLQKVQSQLENKFFSLTPVVDQAALSLWNKGEKDLALQYLTDFSVNQVETSVARWRDLGHFLLIKYKDGNVMVEKDGKFERNESGIVPVSPLHPAYPDWYYRQIIEKNKAHFQEVK
ncbi:MAG TPA: C69 family dipeptidase [Prolixibacteraceae bacterium]|nr:C69 family dipeptidase [Prolixibacteraceae bacterium]